MPKIGTDLETLHDQDHDYDYREFVEICEEPPVVAMGLLLLMTSTHSFAVCILGCMNLIEMGSMCKMPHIIQVSLRKQRFRMARPRIQNYFLKICD